jgi:hypothetical protein
MIGNWTLALDAYNPEVGTIVFAYGTRQNQQLFQCQSVTQIVRDSAYSQVNCTTTAGNITSSFTYIHISICL